MGQNFSWLKQVGHELEQQRAWRQRSGNFRNAVRRICVKIECRWFCKPIKGQSKTTKTRFCQLFHKNYTYLLGKEFGPMLNQENIQSPIMKCRRKWFVFFVMEVYPEKVVEQLNSGESKTIFRNISCIVIIGLTKCERAAWQEEEGKRKDFSIVLIHQEQSCTSELLKVIQDAVLLIFHYRTISLFRTVSSSTFITSDVRSIYIPSSIQDWYREDKFCSACGSHGRKPKGSWHDRLGSTASCTIHAQSMEETSEYGVLGRHQPCAEKKDCSSIRHDRTPSFFTKHSQLIVSRKLFGWKLEKSYTRRYMRHFVFLQRFLWNMKGWKNLVQKLLDNQREHLFNNQKVPPISQPNPNPDHDRTVKPVVCPQRGAREASRSQEIE